MRRWLNSLFAPPVNLTTRRPSLRLEALEDRAVPNADPLDPPLEQPPTPPQLPAAVPVLADPTALDAPALEGVPSPAAPGPGVATSDAPPLEDQGATEDWQWAYAWVPVWESGYAGGVWVDDPPPAALPEVPQAEGGATGAPPTDPAPVVPPAAPSASAVGAVVSWVPVWAVWVGEPPAAGPGGGASEGTEPDGGETFPIAADGADPPVATGSSDQGAAGSNATDLLRRYGVIGNAPSWTPPSDLWAVGPPVGPPAAQQPGLQRLPGFGRDFGQDPVLPFVRSVQMLPFTLSGRTPTVDQQAALDHDVLRDTARLRREIDSSVQGFGQLVTVAGDVMSVGTEIGVGVTLTPAAWWFGLPMVAHGIDRGAAKIESLRTGTPQMSLTAQGLHELGFSKQEAKTIDFILGDGVPTLVLAFRGGTALLQYGTTSPFPAAGTVSFGSPGPNTPGVRVLTADEFTAIQKALEKQGITMYRTGSPTDSVHRVLESGKVQIGLRNDATLYSFLHEYGHQMTYLQSKLTPAQWNALSEAVRERLVFEYIQKNYWGFLTKAERQDAVAYAWSKSVDVDEKLINLPYLGGGDAPGRIVITANGTVQRFAPK